MNKDPAHSAQRQGEQPAAEAAGVAHTPQSSPTHWRASYMRWVLGLVLLCIPMTAAWLFTPRFGALPDFAAVADVAQMKRQFAGYLRPIIDHHNGHILVQRALLSEWHATLSSEQRLNLWQQWRLQALADDYDVDVDALETDALLDELDRRVDIIPADLALAQAAKESGWGRSRFAAQGNNLFGQWCYEPGCGIVPKNRRKGARHEVADFSSVSDAVYHYLHNLNTHASYDDLRRRRQAMRQSSDRLDPVILAEGLLFYSQRREAYVEEIQAMVRQFQQLEIPTQS